jgi:hypothetical protein
MQEKLELTYEEIEQLSGDGDGTRAESTPVTC